jgi:hypothetical protein
MALIFSASGDARSSHHSSMIFEPLFRWLFPHLTAERLEHFHYLFRKGCHLSEYAILGVLFWRAIHNSRRRNRPPTAEPKLFAGRNGSWQWDEAGLSLALVFLYAASDEFHQIFVPTRTALVSDVFIDTCGGACGLALVGLLLQLRRKCRPPITQQKPAC